MNVWRLVVREIAHRKVNFLLALLSVSVAVGCLVGAWTLLEADEIQTQQILAARELAVEKAVAAKQSEVEEAGRQLEDTMRKITKGLGFNILILPENQDRNELNVEGTLTETMPESYVKKLAESRIVTVNHLLPMVMKKMRWEEADRTVLLTGTRGEVPLMHRALKKPLQDLVAPGTLVLGYQLHTDLDFKKGDEVELLSRKFKVAETYEERGSIDDSTVWINLGEAQELLGLQNLVHAILALECNCATVDRVAEIRREIAGILPGTQVIERGTIALARAETRNKAKITADAALAREKQAGEAALASERANRQQLEQRHADFASMLVPVVVVGCAVWIGFLAFSNVRHRSAEIGILRAIGVRSVQILTIFLAKALIVGLIGATVGYVAGFAVAVLLGDLPPTGETWSRLFAPGMLVTAVVMAPLLSGLASWIPAMLAAQQDPAIVLQEQ